MKKQIEKIVAIDHHRNGIFGQPFHVVIFENDGRRMLGIVLNKETDKETGNINSFVLDLDKAADNNIRFGDNSWRGDHYADELREATEKWNELDWKEKYPEVEPMGRQPTIEGQPNNQPSCSGQATDERYTRLGADGIGASRPYLLR